MGIALPVIYMFCNSACRKMNTCNLNSAFCNVGFPNTFIRDNSIPSYPDDCTDTNNNKYPIKIPFQHLDE